MSAGRKTIKCLRQLINQPDNIIRLTGGIKIPRMSNKYVYQALTIYSVALFRL